MPSAHTHRFSWRRHKSLIAVVLLFAIGSANVLPVGVGVAQAQETGTSGTPAPDTAASTAAAPQAPTGPQTSDPTLCAPQGDVFTQVRCVFFLVISEVLLIISSLLGKLLVFLVDILIAFASYNDFGNTIVVEQGWIVVRDLVNMFFIVILLVSAFASIIGYDEGSFHYKRVLPKLLLMAVLINFSRTLILLLVDFSQVMMLTFVNAFQQAGPGNLVAALKIDSVLKIAPPNAGAGTDAIGTAQQQLGTVDPINIILSLMLAIFMLSISLGIVVIMVAYLIFRIVGLWIALILSPIALFATALPGRLQRGMDNFTGKYWSRLSALLVGGPVMAFFLWLTFAVTQRAVSGSGGLAPALNFHVSNTAASFLTSVGNTQDIASFIVGITLMLMGLDAAVSSAAAVSETLGSFASKTASASKGLGRLAATAPFLAGYYGTRAGARYADRRLDVTGKAATAAAATVGQIPILRTALRKPLIAAASKNRRADLAEAEELQKGLENLTPAQRAVFNASTKGVIPTKGQNMAYAQQMMERAAPKNAQAIKDEIIPTYLNQFKAEKRKELQQRGLTDDQIEQGLIDAKSEIENRASQYADRDVASRQAYFLEKAKQSAGSAGDKEMVRKIEEQVKKNPNLSLDKKAIAKELLADKDALNGMSSQGKGDVGVIAAILEESKAMVVDQNGNVIGFDRAKMDKLKDGIKDKGLKENIESVERYINGQLSAGVDVNRKEFGGLLIGKDEKGKARMFRMPVKGAGKKEAVEREVERALSALPGAARATGRQYGPAATMGDFSKTEMAPVMSESAKQAKAAFQQDSTNLNNIQRMMDQVDAGAVFENPGAWTTYNNEAQADLNGLGAATWNPTAAAGAAGHRTQAQVDAALKRFETLASKISDMSTDQQAEFGAMAASQGISKIIVNAKKAGYGSRKSFNTNTKKYLDMLVKIESDIKRTGRAATAAEQQALNALTDFRAELQAPGNRNLANAYRKTVEPEEET